MAFVPTTTGDGATSREAQSRLKRIKDLQRLGRYPVKKSLLSSSTSAAQLKERLEEEEELRADAGLKRKRKRIF